MIRNILILGGALAIAGAAQAQSVNVSIAGKSDKQVRSELIKASERVCQVQAQAQAQWPLDSFGSQDACVSSTYEHAASQARQYRQSAASQSRVASR